MEIESGSAAEEAGLKVGDIVLQVDDVMVRSAEDVLRTVNKSKDLFVVIKVERHLAPRRKGSVRIETQSLIDHDPVILHVSILFFLQIRLETMTPSMTYGMAAIDPVAQNLGTITRLQGFLSHIPDGSDDKSLATATSLDEAGSLLHLPGANSHLPTVKFNNGMDIKRTASHPLDKVGLYLSRSNFYKKRNCISRHQIRKQFFKSNLSDDKYRKILCICYLCHTGDSSG